MLVDSGARQHGWKTGGSHRRDRRWRTLHLGTHRKGTVSVKERTQASRFPTLRFMIIGGGDGEEAAAPRMPRMPCLLLEPSEKRCARAGTRCARRIPQLVLSSGRWQWACASARRCWSCWRSVLTTVNFDGSGKTMPRPVFMDRRTWASRLLGVSGLLELVLVMTTVTVCVAQTTEAHAHGPYTNMCA